LLGATSSITATTRSLRASAPDFAIVLSRHPPVSLTWRRRRAEMAGHHLLPRRLKMEAPSKFTSWMSQPIGSTLISSPIFGCRTSPLVCAFLLIVNAILGPAAGGKYLPASVGRYRQFGLPEQLHKWLENFDLHRQLHKIADRHLG